MRISSLLLFIMLFLYDSLEGHNIKRPKERRLRDIDSESMEESMETDPRPYPKVVYHSYKTYSRKGSPTVYMITRYSSRNKNHGREGLRKKLQEGNRLRGSLVPEGESTSATNYRVLNSSSPIYYRNRPYYWELEHYDASIQTIFYNTTCVVLIDRNDPDFSNIQLADNTIVKEIVFGCFYGRVCCDFDCCNIFQKVEENEGTDDKFWYEFRWALIMLGGVVVWILQIAGNKYLNCQCKPSEITDASSVENNPSAPFYPIYRDTDTPPPYVSTGSHFDSPPSYVAIESEIDSPPPYLPLGTDQ